MFLEKGFPFMKNEILVHGYDSIDDRIVWDIMEEDLDNLIEDVSNLIP